MEATKAAVQAMAAAVDESSSGVRTKPICKGPKLGRSTLKNPTLDWGSLDKYMELQNCRLEANNIFKTYNTNQTVKILIIKKWFGRQGL